MKNQIKDHPQDQNIAQDIEALQQVEPKHKLSFRSLSGIFLGVFLLLTIVVVVFYSRKPQELRKQAAESGVKIWIAPANKTVGVGEEFNLGIKINSGTKKVSAAQISLDYTRSALEVLGFTVADPETLPVALVPVAITNNKVTMTLGAQPANPPSGAAISVGTLKLKAKTVGVTEIKFTAAPSANIVTVLNNNTNALGTKTNGKITVQAISGTPTRTPTPTITLTPTEGATPTPTPTLKGDITDEFGGGPDGFVDLYDYNKVLTFYINHYGETGAPGFTPEDIVGDSLDSPPNGVVDLFDLTYIIRNYTQH